ncbi:uncharacterized protein LOC111538634 [Piliocolobus tephrosceles]|uniref:uncharacterized protein LOC111538634 n=1 Tax=Piliocolobus tephrosceles TaxID=591936 RepID=UPI000C29E278|nr:uncharacterized protein LOC111538634 [Piliocolobus tephrosceles]
MCSPRRLRSRGTHTGSPRISPGSRWASAPLRSWRSWTPRLSRPPRKRDWATRLGSGRGQSRNRGPSQRESRGQAPRGCRGPRQSVALRHKVRGQGGPGVRSGTGIAAGRGFRAALGAATVAGAGAGAVAIPGVGGGRRSPARGGNPGDPVCWRHCHTDCLEAPLFFQWPGWQVDAHHWIVLLAPMMLMAALGTGFLHLPKDEEGDLEEQCTGGEPGQGGETLCAGAISPPTIPTASPPPGGAPRPVSPGFWWAPTAVSTASTAGTGHLCEVSKLDSTMQDLRVAQGNGSQIQFE